MTIPFPDRAQGRRALARLHAIDARWTATTAAAWLSAAGGAHVSAREVTSDRHADRLHRLAQRAEWRAQSGGLQCGGATPGGAA